MLGNGSDLGVYSLDRCAGSASQANLPSVPLQSTVDQSIDLSLGISSSLGIGESLVSCCLLKAIDVGDFALWLSVDILNHLANY
jgi:hypothetical protein